MTAAEPGARLSARELLVVRRLTDADEPTPRKVAYELGVTEETVLSYVKRAYRKLGVRSRMHLLRRLIEQGHVPCPHAHD